jgi:hypothetical protein
MNCAFSAVVLAFDKPLGRCPRLLLNSAPLALNAAATLTVASLCLACHTRAHEQEDNRDGIGRGARH